ncbi:MAG: calcium-translocating P-type ATPase, PMCA-type [Oscillospiraceae bacterium]
MIWHSAPLEEVIKELSVDTKTGLTAGEADIRLYNNGPNQLNRKKDKTLFQKFIEQFKDFMVIILIIAAAVSMLTTIISGENDWLEPIVIVLIVIVNAALGVFQENKAEAALEALKNMAAPSAKVIRDSTTKTIGASELVTGDVILLEAGDYIPADARIFECGALSCEESALTGESVPVQKMVTGDELADISSIGDRYNMVYSGCSVVCGHAKAVVTETGMNTEMGKIATLLESADSTETPLKIKMAQLGKTLGIAALIICGIIFLIGLISGPSGTQTWADKIIELFMTSISLAVAAIPEGLPAIVTVVLALGVQRMVKNNAIVRKLPAVETLGSASVICSDKTGTLTQNRMTLTKLFDGQKIIDIKFDEISKNAEMLLQLGTLCCDGYVEEQNGKMVHIGDPTETAIVAAAVNHFKTTKAQIDSISPRLGEVPFDSIRKLMTTIHMIDGKVYAVVKGAPDILISRCREFDSKAALDANTAMGEDALRVLAVAIKQLNDVPSNPTSAELECDLQFIGLLGMIDPPRPEAMNAVSLCHKAGIKTVMITGDHIATATAIARQLHILERGDLSVSGSELSEMTDEELSANIENIAVFARVSPEDKIRIVRAFKEKGHIVAMTGDGVNDAPALKAADIGCAMGITGTDVAKGAAAMTLTDDNFATIVTAVKEGRGIYDNIKKSVHFLLSCNLGEILTVFFGMIFFGVSPLIAVQLLWINLVTDCAPALALGMEPVEPDIMEKKPRKRDESFFAHHMGITAIWQGVMFGCITLLAYYLGRFHFSANDPIYGNTMAFAVLAFSQIAHAFNVRSSHSLFKTGFHTNKYMVLAAVASIALMLIALLTPLRSVFELAPLNSTEWIDVVALSLIPIIVCEFVKLGQFIYKKLKK